MLQRIFVYPTPPFPFTAFLTTGSPRRAQRLHAWDPISMLIGDPRTLDIHNDVLQGVTPPTEAPISRAQGNVMPPKTQGTGRNGVPCTPSPLRSSPLESHPLYAKYFYHGTYLPYHLRSDWRTIRWICQPSGYPQEDGELRKYLQQLRKIGLHEAAHKIERREVKILKRETL